VRYRAPLMPGEQVVTCNRAHPMKLLRPLLVLLLGIFLASMLQVLGSLSAGWTAAAPIVLVAALVYAAVRGYRWAVTGYALTSRRVVIFRGLGKRLPLAIPWETVEEVRGPRGPYARWAGFGTVRVRARGQSFDLTYQKEPGRFVEMCDEYRVRHLGGLHDPGAPV
jgi:membrane protein YdbS with pleckstrin-like domain